MFLEEVAFLRAFFRLREDFRTLFGHQNGVFKLRRQSTIPCANGPVVFLVERRETGLLIDHRFDSKTKPWQQSFLSRSLIGDVRYVGILVESFPKAMAHILFDDRKAATVGERNNGFSNQTYGAAWKDRVNGGVEAIEGTLSHRAGIVADVANQKSF